MAQQGNPKSSPATPSVNPTHTDALASVRREFSDGLEQESKNELEKAKNTYLKVGEFIQAYFATKNLDPETRKNLMTYFQMLCDRLEGIEKTLGTKKSDAAAKKLEQKKKIFDELIETERSYVQNLGLLYEIFYKPLKASLDAIKDAKPILGFEDFQTIFMKTVIPELLETHLKLLELLEAKHKAWNDQQSVGDAFIKIFPNFIVYTNYVRGFNNADKTLKKCLEENKSFKAFIDKAHKEPKLNLLQIPDLLIMPVQRLPRYQLLLNELLQISPKDSPDFNDIATSLEAIRKVANFVNEKKKEEESANRLIGLQDRIIKNKSKLNLLVPGRLLLKEGPVFHISQKDPKSLRKYYLFLFTDIFMCSKQKASQKAEDTHKYESMMEVNLVDCTVSGNLDAEEQKKMKIKENLDLYFKLTTVKKTYYWKTESSLQRKQWVDEFQKAIQSMKTKT